MSPFPECVQCKMGAGRTNQSRMDFDFFILRFDIGVPVRNPALPIGERWAFQKQNAYHKEIDDFLIANPTMTASKLDYNPFFPHVSFGIGYPF